MDEPVAPEFRVFPDLVGACTALAEELGTQARLAASVGKAFRLVIPGGATPRTLFELLAGRFRDRIPWDSVHLFWSDERWVPHSAPESNYALAESTFLRSASIPPSQVHPIPTDLGSPEIAAERYEQLLQSRTPDSQRSSSKIPLFDLVVLGVGVDGHTASLFPGSPVLTEPTRLVRAVPDSPTPPHLPRVTLTLPAFHRAQRVCFLASGPTKRSIVHQMRTNFRKAYDRFPAAQVESEEAVVWFLDSDAAGERPSARSG